MLYIDEPQKWRLAVDTVLFHFMHVASSWPLMLALSAKLQSHDSSEIKEF